MYRLFKCSSKNGDNKDSCADAFAAQMPDLPVDGKGLGWIVEQDPTKLLLIPGLRPASIVAAAAGDEQELTYPQCTAQHYAAHPDVGALKNLDRACMEAATLCCNLDHEPFITALKSVNARVAHVYETRENHTIQLLIKAAQTGQLAPMMWLHAIWV